MPNFFTLACVNGSLVSTCVRFCHSPNPPFVLLNFFEP
eukprot:UN10969